MIVCQRVKTMCCVEFSFVWVVVQTLVGVLRSCLHSAAEKSSSCGAGGVCLCGVCYMRSCVCVGIGGVLQLRVWIVYECMTVWVVCSDNMIRSMSGCMAIWSRGGRAVMLEGSWARGRLLAMEWGVY